MIEIVANGKPYTQFISATVTMSMESMANDFSFSASSVNGFPDLKINDAIIVFVEGAKVLTGYIDQISGDEAEGVHSITYKGRDKTGDFIDSQIDSIDDLKGDITLQQLIARVIKDVGTPILAFDLLNPAPFNVAEDQVRPQPGQSALEFVQQFAQKRQALLSSTGDGDILITQSEPVSTGEVLQSITGGNSNNIISQNWEYDNSAVFNKYAMRGQVDPLALNFAGGNDNSAVTDQSGVVIDNDVRAGRQRVVVEGNSYSSAQLENRAKWSRQLARSRAVRMSCAIKGHRRQKGGIFRDNQLVQVNSDAADISREMLIATVTYTEGEGQPTITTFDLVEKDVFTISQSLAGQKKVGKQGGAYGLLG